MASRFVNITEKEMDEFLSSKGFIPMVLPNVAELVWGKVYRKDGRVFSMRVYSGIDATGNSRGVGEDAIRVEMFYKTKQGEVVRVGGSKRVNRTKGWKENLTNRILGWEDAIGPACPKCGEPMVLRTCQKPGKNKGRKFYGCVAWKSANCQGFWWEDQYEQTRWEIDEQTDSTEKQTRN